MLGAGALGAWLCAGAAGATDATGGATDATGGGKFAIDMSGGTESSSFPPGGAFLASFAPSGPIEPSTALDGLSLDTGDTAGWSYPYLCISTTPP
ncbi:MAG: hypothetical protein EPN57_00955 [Paraburkholderia sp.]|nr:MAG: hypothetical protein EPN57_00955 [Paraburkholderia sp.]